MEFSRDPPKLKSLTSLFFGKKEKRQSMQGPTPPPLEPGLKTLTTTLAPNHNRSLSCKKPNILSFSSTATSYSSSSSSFSSSLSSLTSPPSTSPSTSSLMDDNKDQSEETEVGAACHAAKVNVDGNHDERKEEEAAEEEEAPQMYRRRRRRSSQKEKEFPPPIPHLARTGNLPCHMPWVLKRSYIDSGRLVIQEVKVKHHEYFRAHRANGRLTLQIMQLDESATSLPWRSSITDSPETANETHENSPSSSSPSSSSSSLSSSSPSSSSSATEDDDECRGGDSVERSNFVPPPLLSPSSLPPPPSMLSKELKNILDVSVYQGCSSFQGSCGINNREDTIAGTRDHHHVMEMGTLPSVLSSSMPESSLGIGGSGSSGGGGGCYLNKRSASLFSPTMPTIRPVHS